MGVRWCDLASNGVYLKIVLYWWYEKKIPLVLGLIHFVIVCTIHINRYNRKQRQPRASSIVHFPPSLSFISSLSKLSTHFSR